MEGQTVKRRRTSTKHSQTGCRTCKQRHIKCDEKRPRCHNCEKGDRDCAYVFKSPDQSPSPVIPESGAGITFTEPSYTFRPPVDSQQGVPIRYPPPQNYPFEIHGDQSFENLDHFAPQRNHTDSSALVIRHPNTTISTVGLIHNANLVSAVQSHEQLRHAIHMASMDLRLRGQALTIESILSPLIYQYDPLKHAIFANFVLQMEGMKRAGPMAVAKYDVARDHYNTAIRLQQTLNSPMYADSYIATTLMLAFYDLCSGKTTDWATRITEVGNQIRMRGNTIAKNPLSLHAKFLFALYMRTATIASNAVCQPAVSDPETFLEIANIVYSGIPISTKSVIQHRIDLEMLLAEISIFQYGCTQYLSLEPAWTDAQRQTTLRDKYETFLDRLEQWKEFGSGYIHFEEAHGQYPCGVLVPPEMGPPLLCNDPELSQMWLLHCTAKIHLYRMAVRFRFIPCLPNEARTLAIESCRIISGASILDETEPSVTSLWSLVNAAYALDFPSGKRWVTDQLDFIAKRYLNRSARIVAQRIRELVYEGNNFESMVAVQSDSSTSSIHEEIMSAEHPTWSATEFIDGAYYETELNEWERNGIEH